MQRKFLLLISLLLSNSIFAEVNKLEYSCPSIDHLKDSGGAIVAKTQLNGFEVPWYGRQRPYDVGYPLKFNEVSLERYGKSQTATIHCKYLYENGDYLWLDVQRGQYRAVGILGNNWNKSLTCSSDNPQNCLFIVSTEDFLKKTIKEAVETAKETMELVNKNLKGINFS